VKMHQNVPNRVLNLKKFSRSDPIHCRSAPTHPLSRGTGKEEKGIRKKGERKGEDVLKARDKLCPLTKFWKRHWL